MTKPASVASHRAEHAPAAMQARHRLARAPAQNCWRVLSELTRKAKLQGGQFHDARIAAICIENGVTALWSADRDFGRFKALKTVNPLV